MIRNLAFRAIRALLRRSPLLLRAFNQPPVVIEGVKLDPAAQLISLFSHGLGVGLSRQEDVNRARKNLDLMARLGIPEIDGVRSFDFEMGLPGREIWARAYLPPVEEAESTTLIIFFHGGGFAIGSVKSHDGCCRFLCRQSGLPVVSVDYRLAPENPYPAAVEDAVGAYDWLNENKGRLGIRAGHIAVMGDSAGGNLAAVVAQKRRGPDGPVAQILLYPVLDARFTTESCRKYAKGLFLQVDEMEWFRQMYLPEKDRWQEPEASPLLSKDLRGLAPALIFIAGFDPLKDDGIAYFKKLHEAGVGAQLKEYPELIHGFFGMMVLPTGEQIMREVTLLTRTFIDKHVG